MPIREPSLATTRVVFPTHGRPPLAKSPICYLLLLALCSLFPVPYSLAQAWSGILDPSRATDWTQAGIPGGVPNRTTICQTVAPSGLVDSTDATNIEKALQACSGTNEVVQLAAGTYTLPAGLTWVNSATGLGATNVVLRGSGPDKTKLVFTGIGRCAMQADVCIEGNDGNATGPAGGSTTWTGDNGSPGSYHKGDTVIDVGSTSGLSVGQIILLDQRNDSIGTIATGTCPNSGLCESGNTVTVTTSIPHGFSAGQTVGIGPDKPTSGSAYVPNGYEGRHTITAVPSPTTFQYADSDTGLAPGGTGEFATVDTGGVYRCDVTGICIESNGDYFGRPCPADTYAPELNAGCAPGEISERGQTEVKRITGINGNQLTIDPPLEMPNWRASQSPAIWWTGTHYAQLDGIEDLTLDFTNDGDGSSAAVGVNFFNAYECWMKNVRSINSSDAHVYILTSGRIEIVDSYFFGTKRGGSESYGVNAGDASSDNLVENNIFQHVVSAVVPENDVGSVYAYNYMIDSGFHSPAWMMPTLYSNHAMTGLDLFEGNDANAIAADNVHGSSMGLTWFRNRLRGQDTPAMTEDLLAVGVYAFNRAENIVGNVLGTPGMETSYEIDSWTNHPNNYLYQLDNTSFKGSVISPDKLVSASFLRWGNYDVVSGAVRWCGNSSDPDWSTTCNGASEIPTTGITFINGNPAPASTKLPASFYLSSQPSFWKTQWGTPTWPAIGPDITASGSLDATCGGSPTACDGVNHLSYQIPAQICYNNTSVDSAYQQAFTVSAASWATGTATISINSTAASNPLAANDTVTVNTGSGFDGIYQVTGVGGLSGAWTFQYMLPKQPPTDPTSGTVTWPNILLFNAATCYPNEFGNPPAPPTSLNATVH